MAASLTTLPSTLAAWTDILEEAAAGPFPREPRVPPLPLSAAPSPAPSPPKIKAAKASKKGASKKEQKTKKLQYALLTPRDSSRSASAAASTSNAAADTASTGADKEELMLIYKQERDELKEAQAETLAALGKAERRLAELEITNEAWREATESASEASRVEFSAALSKAEARAETKSKLLNEKASAALRDVATLRAKQLMEGVHSTTLRHELAHLDGTVGFLVARLETCHHALDDAAREGARQREAVEHARLRSSAAHLEVQHLKHVAAAQKRTIDELREHVSGAQAWAHDVQAQFHETLAQIRLAAAEELTVQGKRMRGWEAELKAVHEAQLQQMVLGGGIGGGGGGIGGGAGGAGGGARRRDGGLVIGQAGRFGSDGASGGAASQTGKLLEMIELERALIAEQARLFADVLDRTAAQQVAVLSKRLADAERDVDNSQRFDKDFEEALQAIGRAEHDQRVASVAMELEGARTRLADQEALMARHEDWMASSVAQQRADFDGVVQSLLERVSQLKSDEAVALSKAAEGDASIGLELQGAEGGGTPRVQERRRSMTLARDMQLLAAVSSPNASSPSKKAKAAGGKQQQEQQQASAGVLDEAGKAELVSLRSRLAEMEEEMRYRLEEASASAVRSGDEYRRELAEAQRWASKLEANVEQVGAALELQKEENGRLDLELGELRAKLEAKEDEEAALVAASGGGGGGRLRSPSRGGGASPTGISAAALEPPPPPGTTLSYSATGAASKHVRRARAVAAISLGEFNLEAEPPETQQKPLPPSRHASPNLKKGVRARFAAAAASHGDASFHEAAGPLVVGATREDVALRPPLTYEKPPAAAKKMSSTPSPVARSSAKHSAVMSNNRGRAFV